MQSSAHTTGRAGWLRRNGLAIATMVLFLLTTVGQALTGMAVHNEDLREHGLAPLSVRSYLASGHFVEAIAENW